MFALEKSTEQSDTVKITMSAHNSLPSAMTDFLFQAAVPKVISIDLLLSPVPIWMQITLNG